MYFASNCVYLREKRNLNQEELAEKTGISRSSIGGYETGQYMPRKHRMNELALFFNVSLDELINGDLSKTGQPALSSTTERGGFRSIIYVDSAAQSQYVTRHNDSAFMNTLPSFSFPKLLPGIFRAFDMTNDSMPPITPGSIVIGIQVKGVSEIANHSRYILVTDKEIVIKRVKVSGNNIELHSDNLHHRSYTLQGEMIREIWRLTSVISYGEESNALAVSSLYDKLNMIDNKIDMLVNQ